MFGKKASGDGQTDSAHRAVDARPADPRKAFCRVCNDYRQFSRCWQRMAPVRQCACCSQVFEKPQALYERTQPACPRCEEFLEQPGFDYGLCDACGSKFELVAGTRPSLLPNKRQRDAMNKVGRAWFPESKR